MFYVWASLGILLRKPPKKMPNRKNYLLGDGNQQRRVCMQFVCMCACARECACVRMFFGCDTLGTNSKMACKDCIFSTCNPKCKPNTGSRVALYYWDVCALLMQALDTFLPQILASLSFMLHKVMGSNWLFPLIVFCLHPLFQKKTWGQGEGRRKLVGV